MAPGLELHRFHWLKQESLLAGFRSAGITSSIMTLNNQFPISPTCTLLLVDRILTPIRTAGMRASGSKNERMLFAGADPSRSH